VQRDTVDTVRTPLVHIRWARVNRLRTDVNAVCARLTAGFNAFEQVPTSTADSKKEKTSVLLFL
jgi:hypothetical protein